MIILGLMSMLMSQNLNKQNFICVGHLPHLCWSADKCIAIIVTLRCSGLAATSLVPPRQGPQGKTFTDPSLTPPLVREREGERKRDRGGERQRESVERREREENRETERSEIGHTFIGPLLPLLGRSCSSAD